MSAVAEPGHVVSPTFDRVDLMLAFAGVAPEIADAWIDNRLVGLTLDEVAAREGVSKAAIGLRVQKAEAAIRRYVARREGRRCRV